MKGEIKRSRKRERVVVWLPFISLALCSTGSVLENLGDLGEIKAHSVGPCNGCNQAVQKDKEKKKKKQNKGLNQKITREWYWK